MCPVLLMLSFLSCKKGDNQPIGNLLDGKLKTMTVTDPVRSSVTQYDFIYDQNRKLEKIESQGKTLLEWLPMSGDSLKLRFYFSDETQEMPLEFLVEESEPSFIRSVRMVHNEQAQGPDTVIYVNIRDGHLEHIDLSGMLYFSPSGLPGGGVKAYNYQWNDSSYIANVDYSYMILTLPDYPTVYATDTVLVEYNSLNSDIPLPNQSFTMMMPWNKVGNNYNNLIIYFLYLSGYHIYQPYTRLPEAVYVNNHLDFSIDYIQNTGNQVTRMAYQHPTIDYGSIDFTYY